MGENQSRNGNTKRVECSEIQEGSPNHRNADKNNDKRHIKRARREVHYRMMQEEKIAKLAFAESDKEFLSNRVLAQTLGLTSDQKFVPIQLLEPDKEPPIMHEKKALHKIKALIKETAYDGPDFFKLDLDTIRLVLITDASFANSRDMKSQLGYLILMVDADNS